MKPDIGIEWRFLSTPRAFNALVRESRRNIAVPFDVERLEWCGWLPGGEKVLKVCLFVLTTYTNVTDTRTDTA